jgi:hypothetical protein
MNEETIEKIERRAYEIWKYRMENDEKFALDELGNVKEITAEDDWQLAEQELCPDRRTISGCPLCGFLLLARNESEIFCLKYGCNFKTKVRRSRDKDIPNFSELKKKAYLDEMEK